MSLFKLRDAWSQKFPGEEFETRGMCIADVVTRWNRMPPAGSHETDGPPEQIICGGFAGVLRVFCPLQRQPCSEDLLVEHNVGAPILQVAAAPVSEPTHNSIVVLCPRRLLILDVLRAEDAESAQDKKKRQAALLQATGADGDTNEGISSIAGDGGAGYTIRVVADLMQQRTAHSLVTGLFGRPPTKVHGICVQSMDGNLDFYSGRHFAFNRFLPSSTFLVPGALAYVERADAFFLGTASFEVECYSWATLAGSTGSADPSRPAADNKERASSGGGGGRKLSPDWSFVVGEDIISLKECRLLTAAAPASDDSSTDIAVLAEHSFLLLNSRTGKPAMNLRLDYAPMCMAVFPHPSQQPAFHNNTAPGGLSAALLNHMNNIATAHQVMIASSSGCYYVHSDRKIIWSAKGHHHQPQQQQQQSQVDGDSGIGSGSGGSAPIAVEISVRSAHCKANGMIVVLSDDGVLSVNYLGTDPAAGQSLQLLQREEVDLVAAIKENAELQRKIQAGLGAAALIGNTSAAAASAAARDVLEGAVVVAGAAAPTDTDDASRGGGPAPEPAEVLTWDPLELSVDVPRLDNREGLAHVDIYVKFPGKQDLSDVTIVVAAADPVAAAQHTHTLAFLPGRSRVAIPVAFGIKPELRQTVPSSLQAEIVASYNTSGGRAVISRASVTLPLALVCRPVPQIKNAPCKLQIDILHRPNGVPAVNDLFADIAAFAPEHATANVLSVHLSNGLDATVLLSKNGGRYRVQSNHFAGLWLLASELVARLRRALASDGEAQPAAIELPDEIPLADLARVVDYHFEARRQLQGAQRVVERLAEQLRAVQRRLIARYREENPAPMKSMQLLFESTYRGMRGACEGVERAALELKGASAALSCAVNTVLLVAEMKLPHLGPEDWQVMRAALSPAVEDASAGAATSASPEVGWEETTVTALTHLLRTTLSKVKGGGAADVVVAQPLALQTDTSKVHKNLQLVFERLLKGARIVPDARGAAAGSGGATGGQD